MLFNCDLCHSTLMLRREVVFAHNLFYDNSFGAEDYELWCRAMLVTDIVNIPEVLGEYRVSEDNITAGKMQMLDAESGRLVARNLQLALGITIDAADHELFQGWSNPFDRFSDNVRRTRLEDFEKILRKIYEVNRQKHFCGEADLLSVLAGKWRWAKYHEPWDMAREIAELDQIFDENYKPSFRVRYRNFCAHNRTFGAKVKKVCTVMLRPLARPFRRRIEGLLNNLEKNICDFVEDKTWDRYLRLSSELKKEYELAYIQMQSDINRLQEQLRAISGAVDARIWKAEQNINQTTDGRIWKAEQALTASTDGRIWKAECLLGDRIKELDQTDRVLDELHRHIDFTYRDLMVAMQLQEAFLPENGIVLETDHPIAYESLDHLYPHGTIRDNTRYPRFVEKCERLLAPKRELAFLDLGCSGGGMVLEAALRGHISMGLEGSDCSQKEQRAEWRLLGERLQTCDITKPFCLRNAQGDVQRFDVITAWEVLEHIKEADLPQLFENIRNHLASGGYFVGSIANWDDIDPKSGVNWHVTVHPYGWWAQKFEEAGFRLHTEDFDPIDLARGAYNPPQCYLKPAEVVYTETSFHIAVKK